MNLRDELTEIYRTHEELTPRTVVRVASNPTHPLHDRFEWNDSVAGQRYREVQAAEMIRSVRLQFVSGDDELRDVRAFVAVRRPESAVSHYEPVDELDAVGRELLIRQARRDWISFKRRYAALADFFEQIRQELDETG